MSNLFANAWHTGAMLAVDTETTGPNPNLDRVVTATAARLHNGLNGADDWLINPGVHISDGAAAIHGVSNERAQAEGQEPAEALAGIATRLQYAIEAGIPLVLFNAAFDLTLLDREFTRHGVTCPLDQALVIDGHVIDKALDKYRKGKRTLTAVCEHYGVRLDGAHDATEDALAAARVAWALAERFPDELQVDLRQLHARQVAWRAEQAASLQSYFRRQGEKDAVVDGGWPIQAVPSGWSPEQLPVPREAEAVAS